MNLEFLMEYVNVIVLGICLCLGYMIKHYSDAIPNKYIPTIMGLLGLLFNVWANNFAFTPAIVLGGLVSGLASTGLYEAFRNIIGNKE